MGLCKIGQWGYKRDKKVGLGMKIIDVLVCYTYLNLVVCYCIIVRILSTSACMHSCLFLISYLITSSYFILRQDGAHIDTMAQELKVPAKDILSLSLSVSLTLHISLSLSLSLYIL